MAVWYSLRPLVKFFPIWYVWTKKNLATLVSLLFSACVIIPYRRMFTYTLTTNKAFLFTAKPSEQCGAYFDKSEIFEVFHILMTASPFDSAEFYYFLFMLREPSLAKDSAEESAQESSRLNRFNVSFPSGYDFLKLQF
jgi:hypothetical protein